MNHQKSKKKIFFFAVVIIIAILIIYQYFGLGNLLTLDNLKSSRESLIGQYQNNKFIFIVSFFAIYVICTATSIPGATILTLAAGMIFGVVVGTIFVSFASTIGATLAFLVSRYLLQDTVSQKFSKWLKPINTGVERDGVFYLLTLRLLPIFPFWLVNLLMGLTSIKAWKFYLISQIGMLLGTIIFVFAGSQIATINSLKDIISPGLLISLSLIGLAPIIAKTIINFIKAKKVYAKYTRPKTFDRNLLIIGAGAGGLVSSYVAAVVKSKVTLVENHLMGGDCLNFGCVPSKAIIRSAKVAKEIKNAHQYGFNNVSGEVDFAKVMARVHNVIAKVAPHDSVERYTNLGVEVIQGYAKMLSPWEVEIKTKSGDLQKLTTKNIIIASGGAPSKPNIAGIDSTGYFDSDTIWQIKTLPKVLVVLGGGPIGCELAQTFSRLGAKVIHVQSASRLLPREDEETSQIIYDKFTTEGIEVLLNHKAIRAEKIGAEKRLIVSENGVEKVIVFDEILCALGRSARVSGFGAEELGITLTPHKTFEVNQYLQTNYPNIYAVGDVAGPYQFTHFAAHQAWYAAVNSLFGSFKKFTADYRVIPWCTFTDPEVAHVGLSESTAKEQGIEVQINKFEIAELDRAIADGCDYGFVKVLTPLNSDKILGATIVGEHAGDLLAEFVLAMKHNLGLNKILGTIHTYPTLSESNKYVAGEWKKSQVNPKLMSYLEKFHNWRRG